MYVTRTGSKNYEFKKVSLPFPLLGQHSYTIMDYTSRQVFIHITHTMSGIQYGNIYKSDSSGSVFSLSLANSVRNNYGYCDFTKVRGMNSVYIANHYEENDLKRARIQFENAETPEQKEQVLEANLRRKSLITFDRGSSWSKITPTVTQLKFC